MQIELTNYVVFPRNTATLFRENKIIKDELLVYMWLRLNANPYGIGITSLSDINNDLLRLKTTNYANKIILALKKQKLLFFKKRTGCRGSFEVYFSDFILPKTKKITNIEKLFQQEESELTPQRRVGVKPELSQTLQPLSQNSAFRNDDIGQMLRGINKLDQVRTSNTDTETNKETNYKQISKDLDNQF